MNETQPTKERLELVRSVSGAMDNPDYIPIADIIKNLQEWNEKQRRIELDHIVNDWMARG